ncbi:hypothetical protein BH11MYX3_BH11MYX3_04210 [soil metagenome]
MKQPSPPKQPDAPDSWDHAFEWLGAHGALPAIAMFPVAMCIIYGGVFRGEIAGDDLTFHMAESRRLADCIAAGDWDFWNPSANGGYASAYYYQVIPQLASALPAALFGHHTFWFQLSVFLPLVLAPLAAYRGMRLMGAVPWQAVSAAFVLSFTIGQSRWGFSADGTFSVGLYTQTWALAAFPLALGHGVRWLRDSQGLAPAVAWGAFVGLCHPFGGVSLGLSLALGVIGGVLINRAVWRSAVLSAVVITLLGGLILAGWFVLGRSSLTVGVVPFGVALLLCIVRLVLRLRADVAWRSDLRSVFGEPVRLIVLGICLGLATMPGWITMLVDAKGFGGFPHRVDDEVGPGFVQLASWHWNGLILDFGRITVLTWALPITLILGRAKQLRWFWIPGIAFALLLGLGPHMPKTADDLIPAVRFLGSMQIMFALGIGTAAYAMAMALWNAPESGLIIRSIRAALRLTGPWVEKQPLQYGVRTGVAAVVAALVVLVAVPGARVEQARVHVLADQPNNIRDQMMTIIAAVEQAPPGRKQVGPGCENHWWNLLSYVYGRVPALLQMGGGGLQASPNYDYLWSVRDFVKNAWLYDAPYLLFDKSKASTMPIGDILVQTEGYELRSLPAPGLISPIQITGILPDGPTGARSDARKAALAWVRTDMPLKNRHLVYAGYGLAGPPPQGTTLNAWRQDSPGDQADLNAIIEVTAPTTFMARESWHPRWHAYLDGNELPVRRVTPDFPAVDVPPGHHLLQFRFERPWWAHASWLMWPGVALLAWLLTRLLTTGRAPRPD